MAVEPRRLLTYEDYAAFPNDGVRREILDGEVVVTPAPNVRHQLIVGRTHVVLWTHVRQHGGCVVLIAPVDVLLSRHDIVQPDVVFVAEDRLEIVTEPNIKGAPSLVVEVVSDPRTDRVRKRALYASAGVPEYWILDPDADRIEVYRLENGRYDKPLILEPGDTLTTDLLPGLEIDVADLLRPGF